MFDICAFGRCGCIISESKNLKVDAVLVSGKEAYEGQKQALNISLTLKTMNIEVFRLPCRHFVAYTNAKSMRKIVRTLWNVQFVTLSLKSIVKSPTI